MAEIRKPTARQFEDWRRLVRLASVALADVDAQAVEAIDWYLADLEAALGDQPTHADLQATLERLEHRLVRLDAIVRTSPTRSEIQAIVAGRMY